MEYQTEVIMTPSLHELCHEIQRLVGENYSIDPEQPPTVNTVCYVCGMRKRINYEDENESHASVSDGISGAESLNPAPRKAGRPPKNTNHLTN